MRDVRGCQTTNESLGDGRVEQELGGWQIDVALRGIDDALGAVLNGGFEQRNHFGRLIVEALGECWVDRGDMLYVDVAIVLLSLVVLFDLVSVWPNGAIIYLVFHDKVDELILDGAARVFPGLTAVFGEDTQSVDRLSIHGCGVVVLCD